jgi:drug/metabolite transporter (DMT)-like permease
MTLRQWGLLYALLGALGFSFKAIWVKLAYAYPVDPETLLALRMLLSLPFFLWMGVWVERRSRRQAVDKPLSGRDWLWMAVLGFLGYYLASYLDFLGLLYITAALERLILFVYPTLVLLLSALFLGKPIRRDQLGALALCYLGVALAVGHDLHQTPFSGNVFLGCALVFGSALSYALYLLLHGEIVGRIGAMRLTAWATSFACAFCLVQFGLLRPLSLLVQPWPVLGLSLGMALLSTVAPVWLISEAIQRLGAPTVSLVGTLGPVLTLFLGWLILDESLGGMQLAGALLVITGVWLVSRPVAHRQPPR